MTKLQSGVSMSCMKIVTFVIWLVVMCVYWGFFTWQAGSPGIKPAVADEAAWTSSYMITPVLTAFVASYIGSATTNNRKSDLKLISWVEAIVIIGATLVFHLIAMSYFVFRVWFATFDFNEAASPDYQAAINHGYKVLLFFGSASLAAVHFVLGRNDIGMGKSS